jgi:integrase/recombinase XerD
MARVEKRKAPAPVQTPLEVLMREHLKALQVQNYSEFTVRGRAGHIQFFINWLKERSITEPVEVTRPVLERYQRHLFHYRKANGEPLSFRSQHARLVPLRVWFRWMTRQNHILHNPASEIELPRLGRALPKNIFSAAEVERVMMQPDIEEPIGLRDRALLEVLYSTGMRRLELVRLKLYELQLDRRLILINQGKGHKDRYVPIGERAVLWLEKYIREARPQLVSEPDDFTVFLTAQGEPFSRDHLSFTVKERIDAAELGKTGSCHLFRHTMATLMHENGADIRYIQQMLGHEDIKTTQIYTQVAILTLQQIHAATHPAELHDAPQAAHRTAEQAGLRAALHAEDEAVEEPGS